MATVTAQTSPVPAAPPSGTSRDHRGSPIPTGAMIATRFMELRKRRGLMIALILVNIGIPTIFLTVRLLAHAFDPKSYGPAGGYSIYTGLVAGVVPLVAVGFTIVCAVCVLAAPKTLNYDGVNVPVGLSRAGFENWAANHSDLVMCDFGYNGPGLPNVPCGPNGQIIKVQPGSQGPTQPTPAQLRTAAIQVARQNYSSYASDFLYPSDSLMIRSGLWLELEALIGLLVGLGLASLLGQRTISVILMLVLEVVLTPIFSRARIPHLLNLQRAVVGVATAHLTPGGIPVFGGGGGGPGGGNGNPLLVPESTTVAVCVIIAWLVVWTALGAWRMMTRDA